MRSFSLFLRFPIFFGGFRFFVCLILFRVSSSSFHSFEDWLFTMYKYCWSCFLHMPKNNWMELPPMRWKTRNFWGKSVNGVRIGYQCGVVTILRYAMLCFPISRVTLRWLSNILNENYKYNLSIFYRILSFSVLCRAFMCT